MALVPVRSPLRRRLSRWLRPPSLFSFVFVEESSELRSQVPDARRCDLPDELVVDDGVPVDEHVPEGDDPWQVRDQAGGVWVETAEPVECLADDLELSLDCSASITSLS